MDFYKKNKYLYIYKNANYIVRKGKGLLAVDESINTIGKHFASIKEEKKEEKSSIISWIINNNTRFRNNISQE